MAETHCCYTCLCRAGQTLLRVDGGPGSIGAKGGCTDMLGSDCLGPNHNDHLTLCKTVHVCTGSCCTDAACRLGCWL